MGRAAPPRKSTLLPAVVIVSVTAVALLALVALVMVVIRPRGASTAPGDDAAAWEAEHREEISRLNDDAETLALQGKLKEAHAAYQQLARLTAGRPIQDAALAQLVSTARRNQDQIYQKLLAAVAATSPPPSEPSTPIDAAPAVESAAPAQAPAFPSTADAATSMPAVAESAPPLPPPGMSQLPGVPKGPVTDEQIGQSIQRGVDFLLSQFKDGQYRPKDKTVTEAIRQGTDALCVYALATAGKAIIDPRLSPKSPEMIKMLDGLKVYQVPSGDGNVNMRFGAKGMSSTPIPSTYTHSLRACTLALLNRPQDRALLQADVDWLIGAETDGAYTYNDRHSVNRNWKKAHRTVASSDAPAANNRGRAPAGGPWLPPRPFPQLPPAPPPPGMPPGTTLPFLPFNPSEMISRPLWDNSNSQYGLLGVWAGAEVGIEVPSSYWHDVESHWTACQLADGRWPYMPIDQRTSYSMTCAGVASLLVTHDYLDAPLLGTNFSPQPYSSSLQKGIAWLEDGDHAVDIRPAMWFPGYSLYGMERVGLASGYKYFGEHNWFVELAARQLPMQMSNGSFLDQDNVVETAFMLLFLSRGRHPIIANKLRFDGYWTNRPRDLANLANFISRAMERPVNWQVVDARREAEDWADAPILYIASHQALKFDDALIAKLSRFVANGGILFTHADANSPELTQSVQELAKKMFPPYPLADLPDDHALFTLNYKIPSPLPRLMGVSNGYRLLLVHSPSDLSDAWQTRSTVSRKAAFELGANLYLYATGKEKFRNRLDSPIVPPPDFAPARTIAFARLKHGGNWDPEPAAWSRFARKLQWETGVQLEINATPIAELSFAKSRIAHLTGTEALTLNDAELASCRTFVASGGTLVIDPAGGTRAFAQSAASWLPQLLGTGAPLRAIGPDDGLLRRSVDGTVDLPAKSLRLYAFERLGTDTPRLQIATLGKGRVIFSSCDIATGLLGTNTWDVIGYLPEYSEALVRNVILTAFR